MCVRAFQLCGFDGWVWVVWVVWAVLVVVVWVEGWAGMHRVAACVGNGMLVAVVCLPVVCV